MNVEISNPSRRKLVLKTHASDPSKALVLYQPFPGGQCIGKNLALNANTECKPANHFLKPTNKIESKEKCKKTCETSDPKTSSYGNIFLLGVILIVTVILSLTSSYKDWDLCDTKSMEVDLKLLKHELTTNLYGQLPAAKTIIDALEELQVTVEQMAVLVLLGGPGTGKTWTTHLIANSMSEQTNQVSLHLGPWSNLQEIQMAFHELKCCHWNLIFIEDSDYANSQLIETLLDMVSSVSQNISCARQKIVIILTSNYGQKEFAELLFHERERFGTRHTVSHEDIRETIKKLTSHLINGFAQRKIPFVPVPYLPLEKMQLEQCIHNDLQLKKKVASPDLIDKIIQHFRFIPPRKDYFVAAGCKTVPTFVNLYT
ncbi:torsin-2A-like [Daphnia carinata]|uniref:torsin-2A-like n=1 Tax=Daphnia carinata TaxID=120202 RepID=UPI00257C51D7|nr:torsin-2A-like [Daphnia carinata]